MDGAPATVSAWSKPRETRTFFPIFFQRHFQAAKEGMFVGTFLVGRHA
jgi:hypothetical protein